MASPRSIAAAHAEAAFAADFLAAAVPPTPGPTSTSAPTTSVAAAGAVEEDALSGEGSEEIAPALLPMPGFMGAPPTVDAGVQTETPVMIASFVGDASDDQLAAAVGALVPGRLPPPFCGGVEEPTISTPSSTPRIRPWTLPVRLWLPRWRLRLVALPAGRHGSRRGRGSPVRWTQPSPSETRDFWGRQVAAVTGTRTGPVTHGLGKRLLVGARPVDKRDAGHSPGRAVAQARPAPKEPTGSLAWPSSGRSTHPPSPGSAAVPWMVQRGDLFSD